VMTTEQYLDAHQAEVFAKIAEGVHPDDAIMTTGTGIAMLGFAPDWIEYDPINNAEQAFELAVFLFKMSDRLWEIQDTADEGMDLESRLIAAMQSDNPPRGLVLVAMQMLGIGE